MGVMRQMRLMGNMVRITHISPITPMAPSCPIVCKKHCDSEFFRKAITVRPDETIANIAITLIHQTDMLPGKLIERQKTKFLTNGGIKDVFRTQGMAEKQPIRKQDL
ncbi:putative uncharacterized protein [Prevotella sp. CAG:1058]|nr:putative uncharacterized protein [Prevotella sp. CAG:1058]